MLLLQFVISLCNSKPTIYLIVGMSKFVLAEIVDNIVFILLFILFIYFPIFLFHMLGTIGQSNAYLFLLSFTKHLMSLEQNQKSYSILLMEHDCFLSPLYVGACHNSCQVPLTILVISQFQQGSRALTIHILLM